MLRGRGHIIYLIVSTDSISSVHVLDEQVAQASGSIKAVPRQYKFWSLRCLSYLTGFNLHCSITEGQVNIETESFNSAKIFEIIKCKRQPHLKEAALGNQKAVLCPICALEWRKEGLYSTRGWFDMRL